MTKNPILTVIAIGMIPIIMVLFAIYILLANFVEAVENPPRQKSEWYPNDRVVQADYKEYGNY